VSYALFISYVQFFTFILSFLQQDGNTVYGVNIVFFNPDYAVATYCIIRLKRMVIPTALCVDNMMSGFSM